MPRLNSSSRGPLLPSPFRPYRSHKIPACYSCRRRKSRCTRDLPEHACLLCRVHGVECSSNVAQVAGNVEVITSRRQPSRMQRSEYSTSSNQHASAQAVSIDESINETDPPYPLSEADGQLAGLLTVTSASKSQDSSGQSGHIIGPAVARDFQVLEQYLCPTYSQEASHVRPNPYKVYSDDPKNPVVYMKVPRRRGIPSSGNGSSAFVQFETMEKILEPLGPDLVSLYFESFHPSFPILDECTVVESYRQGRLPHTLVCEIYAASLIFWNTSKIVLTSGRKCPDIGYMWNLAVSALNEDFLASSFSTVLATILDLTGRPTTSMTYNAVNIGRAVALSKGFGLNRNPETWKLDQRQKDLRIRAWWGLLIHDWWASLTHGTPPHISKTQYDVEVPQLEALLTSKEKKNSSAAIPDARIAGAHCFIAICKLTVILGEVLSLVYDLPPCNTDTRLKTLRRVEASLDRWEDSLPGWLNYSCPGFKRESPGALNLHLSFLATKMCVCRVVLQTMAQSNEVDNIEGRQYYLARCRKAAQEIVQFVITLQIDDMTAFWFPYSAYHLTSTIMLILRCALESRNGDTAQDCLSSAKMLVEHLRRAKDEANWDLGDICLTQCEALVQRLSDGTFLDAPPNASHSKSGSRENVETEEFCNGDNSTQQQHLNLSFSAGLINEELSLGVSTEGVDNNWITSFPPDFGMNSVGLGDIGVFAGGQDDLFWNPSLPDLWHLG